jgi:hypothetical protein
MSVEAERFAKQLYKNLEMAGLLQMEQPSFLLSKKEPAQKAEQVPVIRPQQSETTSSMSPFGF